VCVRVEQLTYREPVGGFSRGELEWLAIDAGSSESDEVDAGKRVVDLLHGPAGG
jgi:hypothetical protein